MPTYLPANNPLGRTDFVKDQRALRPLPPPGNRLDGRDGEDQSGLFASTQQTTVITLGGSTATGDISTLTLIPTRTAHGSPWADNIPSMPITVTTGATQTLTALGELIETEAAAIVAITSLTDPANWLPLKDFFESITAAAGVITIVTRDAGARFTYTWVSDGSATETSTTTGDDDNELTVGTVVVVTATASDGSKTIAAPVAASAATAIMGVVKEGNGCKPAASGYAHKVYPMGWDVPVMTWGTMTAYGEGAATADGQVYVRKTATGTELAGALSGTATTDTAEVYTLTPTAVDSTLYRFFIQAKNFFTDAIVASGIVEFTSGVGTTATLICDGLRTSLADDNDQLDAYVTGSGTATLILTAAAGYKLTISPTAPGVLAGYTTPSTAGASDHLLWAGAKFLQTTTAAGIQAIIAPHP